MPLISIGRADPTYEDEVGIRGEQGIRVNLKTFRSIINDSARPHLFQIDIPSIEDSSIALTMLAKSSILPAMTLEDKGFDFQGSKYKMAGHATFDDWNVTFVADEFHKLRHKFLAWQSLIYDPIRQTPFTAGSYKKNGIKVIQLSKDAKVVSGYEFYGMYPSRVGEINLDQGSNEVETFTVTFSYDYYIINTDIVGNKSPEMASLDHAKYVYAVNHMKYSRDENKTSSHSSKIGPDEFQDENGENQHSSNINPKDENFRDENGESEHGSNLLVDKAGNQDSDYNGKGASEEVDPWSGVKNIYKKLSPFGPNGDINSTDASYFFDYLNWMTFRYSPPLRWRVRNKDLKFP